MCARHRTARQPLEAICVIACSTIAVGSGISISSTPIRIMPPAMPNRPDRNAVATIRAPRAAIISGVTSILPRATRAELPLLPLPALLSAEARLLAKADAGRGLGRGAASTSNRKSIQHRYFCPACTLRANGVTLLSASVYLRVIVRRLLFLNGIKAFEAAARSGSFAAAGLELNVSAAAISRMVHLLEQRLGVALFERKANRLALTAAGRAYQSGLTPIFDALASLTAQVTAPASRRVLTIGVGPTFAMRSPISARRSPRSRCASPPAAWPHRSATTGAAASRSATAPGRGSSPSRCSPPT